MKRIVKYSGKVSQGVATSTAIISNPLSVIFDRIIAIIIQSFIPIPFIGELVAANKKPILVMFASVVIVLTTFLLMAIVVIVSPLGFLATFNLPGVAALSGTGVAAIPIDALVRYKETGFVDTDIPTRDPFGGGGSIITAQFHDANYYNTFHLVHEGIDLVPSAGYYASNQAYQKVHAVIFFATISGTANSYTDSYGALTVAITNNQGTVTTVYKHMKQILMRNGSVHAGDPVGVMGETGFAFGEHLHYEVRKNDGGIWVAVNPLGYIH